jgi:hypothetical protein
MRCKYYLIPAVCLLIPASAVEAQPGKDLKVALLTEAPKKWNEYRARARKMQGMYTLTHSTTQPDVSKTVRTDSFQQNATSAVLVWGHTQLLNGNPKKVSTHSTVWGQNPAYAFQLMRDDAGKPWVGAALELGNKKPLLLGPIIDKVVWSVTPQFRAGLLKPLPEALSDKEFIAKKVSLAEVDGVKLVRLDFEYKEADGSNVNSHAGWVIMDPNQYWHMTEAVIKTESKQFTGQYEVKFEFGRGKGDLPLIKRSSDKVEGIATGSQQLRSNVVEWMIREDDAVPDANFRLSAFGLPEPMAMTEAGASRAYLWFYAIALGFFSVAGLCQFLRKRGLIGDAA